MSNLPEGWVETTLGDLGKWSSGGTPKSTVAEYYGGQIPWIRTGDLRHDVLIDVEGRITSEGLKNSSAKLFPAGTLLIAMYGATIGKTAVTTFEAATNQACAALLPIGVTANLIPFVWKYLISLEEAFNEIGQGGAQPNISQTIIKRHPIPLPPLAEQGRIVEKLDALSAQSAAANTALTRTETLITRYKAAVLASAVRGRMTNDWREANTIPTVSERLKNYSPPEQPRGGREASDTILDGVGGLALNIPERTLPTGWEWVPLNHLARQETGHTPSRSKPQYWDGGIPWIGIKDARLHHGGKIVHTLQTVTQLGLDNSASRLLPKGTVCLSRTASVGYVFIMGREMATSQDFVTWTCGDLLLPKYLMYALMGEGEEIRRFGKGTTHTTIYFPEVRAMHIALPPLEEQAEIVARIEAAFAQIETLARATAAARAALTQLDRALLTKAFQGKLVPQNPNDEPASELLARMKEAGS